ncbi:VanW family protein [Bacillus sonorensis]|uniref:VanW family protein n=1 Tax=Bacillus sonorensis TaxID=119858 RepID=UPI00227E2186|nr:VanW family protein [Bacillus sonorensis]MCY7855798.1 VanW family protein [Bacillus sonorensis]MCY8562693.1 VanW family protein [Bacillus sonorensis]MCZ0069693.1 VanW family protein [Bacillus sonorensis]MCZ0097082.1 VanW family protein [Bacillus sonorensis]MEC1501562.1 VanW family protein [Bacillus sonorensis]
MMKIWITGLLLLAQPADPPDSLTITQQGRPIAVVNRENFTMPFPGTPIIDDKKYGAFIDQLDQQIYRAPINAIINDKGRIVPGKVGYKLYRQAFKEQFYTYFFGSGPSKVEVPELNIYPKVDSELLAHIRVQQIGRYVTYFNSGNKSRSHNISLAAKAIDNHVVFPGETFSFNRVVGKRTEEKGYMSAPIIVKGELSEGVGGGICQVSSTLYNAVDRAGLKIVQRYSHSRRVPYVPPGRDATVSWNGPDFRFQNKYNQPVLIRAKQYGGSMAVMLYSSDVIKNEMRDVPKAPSRLPTEKKDDPNHESSAD